MVLFTPVPSSAGVGCQCLPHLLPGRNNDFAFDPEVKGTLNINEWIWSDFPTNISL